jgi:serine/threonine protein kinase
MSICCSLKSEFKRSSSTTSHSSAARPCDKQEYNWIDGAESLNRYSPCGYHPVMIGDVLHGRYRIVDKLGFGGYSTIWLARDTRLEQYIAIKVCIADAPPHESRILKALLSSSTHPGQRSIPYPLDEFDVHGPNGTHLCYTMAPARCNLREVSFSRLLPLEVARALSGSLTIALAYTHSQGYVHGGLLFNPMPLLALANTLISFQSSNYMKNMASRRLCPLLSANKSRFHPTFQQRLWYHYT